MDRIEEEKVTQAPIVVVLGGEKYDVAPLVIRDSGPWRKKIIGLIAPLPGLINTTMEKPEDFGEALSQMLVVMPDKVIDLFFDYAKNLDRDKIEAVATDAEIAKAFEEVIAVAFPLAQSAPNVLKRIYQTEPKTKAKHSR